MCVARIVFRTDERSSTSLSFEPPDALIGIEAPCAQRAGLGLDKIRAFGRHGTMATLLIYVDEHDRQQTQKTLGDIVASALTA